MTGVLGRLERGGRIERGPTPPTGARCASRRGGGRIPGGFKARPGDTAGPVTAAAAGKKADTHPGCPPICNTAPTDPALEGWLPPGERECRGRRAYAHAMSETARFQQRTASVGMKVDVTDIADTFELLDSYDTETAR